LAGSDVAARLSILHPAGALSTKANPFGKDVANLELFRALARHGGFEQIDVLSQTQLAEADLRAALLGGSEQTTKIVPASVLNTALPAQSGALLRGQPDLSDIAWIRRTQVGDRAYSLLGLTHTIAPPFMRQVMAMASVGPVQPWDAVICTSPSVRDAVARMYGEWGEHLAERTGGKPPPQPQLPIVPLGVDGPGLAALADRPEARARRREALGLVEADILALWVGRLSFFEKAFPQPMFIAARKAAEATGAKVCFALAGWFPGENDRGRYEEAARRHAGDTPVHFLDGNDRELLGELWAGSDIFLSLVDNIQETFGITPLEAMAAGLPVVASDWDGYRYTMRDGVEAFLIPTLGGPQSGLGGNIVQQHIFEVSNYQVYVGQVAQHTAVHVGRAAEALARLIGSPELRRQMGAAGRARIAQTFAWQVVAPQYHALVDELATVRAAAREPVVRRKLDPVRGDPFIDFAGFATDLFTPDTRLAAVAGARGADVLGDLPILDRAFGAQRATPEECARALDLLVAGEATTSREVLEAFPQPRRRAVEMGLMWMAKLGLIDWLV
jgi:D-inositol-3-phosphate glycosyltransferase